jgi:hypothetical protein
MIVTGISCHSITTGADAHVSSHCLQQLPLLLLNGCRCCSVPAKVVHEPACHVCQLIHRTAGHLLDLLHVLLCLQAQSMQQQRCKQQVNSVRLRLEGHI